LLGALAAHLFQCLSIAFGTCRLPAPDPFQLLFL